MAAVIAVFDDPVGLEKAITELVRNDFKERVFDPAVDRKTGAVDSSDTPTLVSAPGIGPVTPHDRDNLTSAEGYTVDASALRIALSELSLDRNEAEFFEQAFLHGGKCLIVETDGGRRDEVLNIVNRHNPSRVESVD